MTPIKPADQNPKQVLTAQSWGHTGPAEASWKLAERRQRVIIASGGRANAAPAWQVALVTAIVSVGLCLAVGFYSMASRPNGMDRVVLCLSLLAPAVALAAKRSTLLLDYLLVVVATNRELRRLLDWGQGQYDSTSLLSLLPMLTAFLMAMVVVGQWRRLPRELRRAGGYLVGAMAYGMALGMIGYGFASLYACAEWLTPLVILYYCVASRPSIAIVRRWSVVLGTLGVLVGAYGIYQWTDPPPWDASWAIWSTMTSSMGQPLPYQFSICSTLESRGPAAMFFAATSAALITLPTLRRGGGVLLAVVPAFALLLTQVRTGLICLILSVLATALFARRGGFKLLLALIVAGGVTVIFVGRQNQSNVIFDRVGTLGHLQDDGSTNGRIGIASQGASLVLTHPQGFGFGSGGNASKVGNVQADAIGDNGYLEILSTLGIPGTVLYAWGLWILVRRIVRNRQRATASEATTQLGFGMLIAIVPGLMVSNLLITAHAAYMWVFLSRHFEADSARN